MRTEIALVFRLPFLLMGLALLLGSSCREAGEKSLGTEDVTFKKEGELRVHDAETDSTLVRLDIEIAQTDYEVQTGLMYRKDMGDLQGMLFVFEEEAPHSFYMKNTLIALDILFIDSDLKIVNIHRDAQPLNEAGIPSGGPVQYVLEVKAGMSDRWGLEEGDRIQYEKLP
ncbi:MAG: DUF192 domain-containing protein [Robiginitalea sp.]|nr:DUF192 domain-containing protein [Robiginitalea sp.]